MLFKNWRLLVLSLGSLLLIVIISIANSNKSLNNIKSLSLLTEPFLQLPTNDSVRVIWFTEFEGKKSYVNYGDRLENKTQAVTTKLSRMREDEKSNVDRRFDRTTNRDIWRHEAKVTGLTSNIKVPYRVITIEEKQEIKSREYTLSSKPKKETPLKILLTSDHQLKPMTAANLQKVVETVGQVDGVFFAGDLINIPDRASEWFDDNKGGAFFPCLQGKANYIINKNNTETVYKGGEIIQNAPLYTAIGNHEVMGRYSTETNLSQQFEDPIPVKIAEKLYRDKNLKLDPEVKKDWIKNNSFNTDTYEEIFSLPHNQKYYAETFGDIRLIVLYITSIWRPNNFDSQEKGRYQENSQQLNNYENWGYGQHIFEPITPDSNQYQWLKQELASDEFQKAKYKIVMFHHPPHSIGDNVVPSFTDPQQIIDRNSSNEITSVKYEYPLNDNYLTRYLIPLLEDNGVQFVYYGHCHLWNRFKSPKGINFLESSNVGNTYGAYWENNQRKVPNKNKNLTTGDPNGLKPIVPNIAPLKNENQKPLPYIASNDITVFSILDTAKGTVTSYRYDTSKLNSEVIKFDEFKILNN